MSFWDNFTSGVSNIYDKGMDYFSGDEENKQPTSIDPHNNNDINDIVTDGKEGSNLLANAAENTFAPKTEVNEQGGVDGYSEADEDVGFFRKGTNWLKGGIKNIGENYSNIMLGNPNPFQEGNSKQEAYSDQNQEWDDSNKHGWSTEQSLANTEDLMKTYGTTDTNKIKEYNQAAARRTGGDVDKFMEKKKKRQMRRKNVAKGVGEGLANVGKGLLDNASFEYDLF